MSLVPPILQMMLRGTNVDGPYKNSLSKSLKEAKDSRLLWFEEVLGHVLNPDSNPQMKELIYGDFKVKPVIDRKTGNPTLDDTALARLARATGKREGRPEDSLIQEIRTKDKLIGTYLEMELDDDGRFRTAYKPKGTKTGRLSAEQTYWNTGGNA